MTFGRRAAALTILAALGLGACTSTTTATTGSAGSTTPSTTAAPTTTAVSTTKAPGTTAMNGAVELQIVTTPYGKAIGRGDGHVLYAWDMEADGTVKCVQDACLAKWPPYTAESFTVGAGLDKSLFSLITRPDGTKQVALQGKPLYAMAADDAGDANCQGVQGWWILNPDGTKNDKTEPVKP